VRDEASAAAAPWGGRKQGVLRAEQRTLMFIAIAPQ
jgi:hypothetical protein